MKPKVVMYSRQNCHLCEVAREVVESAQINLDFEFQIVYIETNAELESKYGEIVPVTLINQKTHDFFSINLEKFTQTIEALLDEDN